MNIIRVKDFESRDFEIMRLDVDYKTYPKARDVIIDKPSIPTNGIVTKLGNKNFVIKKMLDPP